jgi:hypothetical protein
MRPNSYPLTLAAKVDISTRLAVEQLAEAKNVSMGAVTRELLDAGMKAMGIKCEC